MKPAVLCYDKKRTGADGIKDEGNVKRSKEQENKRAKQPGPHGTLLKKEGQQSEQESKP